MKLTKLLSATALASAAFALPQVAWAQQATGTLSDAEQAEQGQEAAEAQGDENAIVVTGSRIRRDAYSTAEPITVINSEEVTLQGFNSTTEALQSTAVTGGTSQINNYFGGFVTDGGTGANTLGLRGLGPSRTLILLNGHRLAPAGTRGSVGSTDLNVLPTAMINQIEILKAGASSIYGSDAIAGVVNIVTKNDLNGITLEAQHNIPEIGAGMSRRYSAVFGSSGDRWNVAGSVEYYEREAVRLNDVDFINCPTDFRRTAADRTPGSADFIDPRTGQAKCFPLDNGGVTINTLGLSNRAAQRAPGVPATVSIFNRFRPNAAATGGLPGYEGVGGTGVNLNVRDTFDPRSLEEELITPTQNFTAYLQGSYELGILGNSEVYFETLFNRRQSSNTLYRQLSLDYTVPIIADANGDPVAFDTTRFNPLVPANMRNSLFAYPTETTNGEFIGARAFIGFGNTAASQEVEFFKVGGGLRGELAFVPGWRYDFYASKSFSDGKYTTESFLTDRLAASTDVVQNPDGTFRCRSSAPGCVPQPVLTPAVVSGQLSDEFRDWIVDPVTGTNVYRETNFSFVIDGPLFRMPGGMVQVAAGAEYRSQRIDDTPPEDSQAGNLFGLTSATPTRGTDSVWEVFGEVDVPILSNVPFFYRLNVNGSLRYTDYESYGGNETYKISGEWEPIRGVAFRGSYGTSYRAPALFEQFLGATSGFLASTADICSEYGQRPAGDIVRANCAAAGLPIDFVQTSGVTVLNAGGAASGLEAETSTNWGAGLVLRPRFGESFGDFSAAVDYFDITVDNGVSRVGAGGIISRCYNGANFNLNEGFCRLLERDGNNRLTVNNNYINLATDIVRGIEYNVRYSRQFGEGRLTLNGAVTQYLEQSNRLFEDDPIEDQNGIITAPAFTGTFDATYRWDGWTLRYGLNWIDGDKTRTYEYFELDPATTPFFLEVDDYFTHTASVQKALENFTITVGVRNFTNSKLPRISSGVFSLQGNAPIYSGYDYLGRSAFVNVAASF